MADPYVRTFGQVKLGVARAAGDLVEYGTTTSGSTTQLDDTAKLIDATDARLKGVYVYGYNGTGQGQESRATAFTPASDRITTPTQSASWATTDYFLTRRFPQSQILEAIRQVLYSQGRWGKTYVDQSLIYGSPLVNATFYDNSGTFPNGWTQTGTGGTFTRNSTISKHGRYSCSMVSDGTNACGIRQDALNVGLYRGLSATLRGWVHEVIGVSRVTLGLDDSVTAQSDATGTATNRGWGSQEFYTTAITVSDRATRLRASGGITAGSAVTAYFSGLWITPLLWTEWNIPAGSPTAITEVKFEEYAGGPFSLWMPNSAIEIVRESTRRIRLNAASSRIPAGRIIEIAGRTSWADHATAATDDDTSFDGMYEWLVPAAAAYLLKTMGGTADDKAAARDLQADADSRFRQVLPALPASAVKIETGTS